MWGWIAFRVYVIGFVLVFGFNIALGPITMGLSLMRGAVWPVYVTTGWPHGTPLRMD